ncbi:MAG TPA: hypothetical protein VGS57_20585 [Thermoanaerobaculia bacterium]|jgi:hypothetical protein|nr:hypothetical protein [Thermoanaerobaculia bacterium]
MVRRATLHQLLDTLPDEDLPIAGRLLAGLNATISPVERALLLAPPDDEADADDDDGGLSEARRERERGEGSSTEQVRRELGLE